MPLLPYMRYELVSAKAPSEVEAAMRAAVEPRRFLGFGTANRPFEGKVGDGVFRVQRAIGYRNSFLPQIGGRIIATPEGSRITVSMKLHPLVLVFMTIWMGGVGAACVQILIRQHRHGSPPLAALIPAAMFAFGWALAAGAFTYEARKAEPLLASTMMARATTGAVPPAGATSSASRRP